MLHQELIRATTLLVAILFLFYYLTRAEREAVQLRRDCGIVIEQDKITDKHRADCNRYLKEMQKYKSSSNKYLHATIANIPAETQRQHT